MAAIGLIGAFSWLVIGLLLLFTARRLLVVAAGLLPAKRTEPDGTRSVAVIVPALNEEEHLPGLFAALEKLDYPRTKIHFTLVDDASTDATLDIFRTWAGERPNAQCVALEENLGKSEALNHGLAAAPESELVAVYDADLRPQPDSLKILAGAFANEKLGAVAGLRRPANVSASLVTAYGALESFVHQLITQSGKDRLGLNPTTIGGNCVYRREALEEIGGFAAGSFSEDVEASLAMAAAGWSTGFRPGAAADDLMVQSLHRYWNQRCRWTRGLYRAGKRAAGLEAWLVSAGYLDRLVLLAALGLAAPQQISPLWLAVYAAGPAAAVAGGLWKANLGAGSALRVLVSVPPMFVVDVAVSVVATFNSLLGVKQRWRTGGASS